MTTPEVLFIIGTFVFNVTVLVRLRALERRVMALENWDHAK